MKIFDVSHHQGGSFPFEAMADAGYDGVIIRTGDGVKQDREVITNMTKALDAGLWIGLYHFSRAKTFAEGAKEGKLVREIASGLSLPLGIFVDMEVYKDPLYHTNAYRGFCTAFEGDGVEIGIYTNEYNYNHYFDKHEFAGVRKWIAKYSKTMPNVGQEIWGWQYTSGTDTNEPYKFPLDRSIVFENLEENDGTLGTGSPDKPVVDIYWVIMEIMDGAFGDGEDRRKAMEAIGVDYDMVQTLVNKYYGVAMEVLAGKYGNQPKRKPALERAGYNFDVVQKIVNAIKG